MPLRSQIAALCLAALAAPVAARPFTVEDLLAAEEFGQVGFSPDGAHLVFERLLGQAASGPFDQDVATGYRRGRLYVADLRRGTPPRPLLPALPGEGQIAGPFSPDGGRMAVLRFAGRRYEAGVVTLATGEVRWLGVSPELGLLGQTLVWKSPHELLIAARPAGEPPMRLRVGPDQRADLPRLWADTAAGETAAVRVVGSGARLAAMAPPAAGALVLVDLRTAEVRRLAEGDFYDLELSPDGRQVAAMQRLGAVQAPAEARLYVAAAFRRRNLVIADLAGGAVSQPCPGCHLSTHLIAWSPDSREVLTYGRIGGAYRGTPGYLRLSIAAPPQPLPTPGLAPVVDRTNEGYEIPRAAWVGGAPVVLARPGAGGRADWWRIEPKGPSNLTAAVPAEPGPLAGRDGAALLVPAGGGAWRVAADGASTRLFAAAEAVPASGLGQSSRRRINAVDGPAWFRTPAPHKNGAGLRASDGGRAALPPRGGRSLALTGGPTGVAQVRREPAGPLELAVLPQSGRRRVLARLNEDLREVNFAEQLLLPIGQGDDHHVLLLPRGLKPGARPPLVVIPYLGLTYAAPPEPYGRGVGRFSVNAEIFAAAGFAVLLPSLPRIHPEPGAGLADQILAAVDRAAATGRVDADRLALVGHSFGGYGSLMAASQSGRFRTVIASGAPTDLAAMYGAFDPHAETRPEDGLNLNNNYGWAELGQAGLGEPPWRAPEVYRRNSPYFLADKISAPVLLLHGDADFVRLSQAQQMFSALYRQGKDAELVTYFGEGHIISGPANLRDKYARMVVWLRRGLAEPPMAPPLAPAVGPR